MRGARSISEQERELEEEEEEQEPQLTNIVDKSGNNRNDLIFFAMPGQGAKRRGGMQAALEAPPTLAPVASVGKWCEIQNVCFATETKVFC